MGKEPDFSSTELAAIEAAVRAAEARTTGEIYCVVAEASGDYLETPIAWAAGVALLVPALLLLGGIEVSAPAFFNDGWTADQVGAAATWAARNALMGAILLQAALFAVVAVIAAMPPVRLRLTPQWVKRDRVRRRAREQFLAKNLHLTRERTGVLLFVSAAEHMAEIVADEGIAERVSPAVWDRAMTALTSGLKRGETVDAFTTAVALCGEVLADQFPADPADNPNELPDAVVLLPRL